MLKACSFKRNLKKNWTNKKRYQFLLMLWTRWLRINKKIYIYIWFLKLTKGFSFFWCAFNKIRHFPNRPFSLLGIGISIISWWRIQGPCHTDEGAAPSVAGDNLGGDATIQTRWKRRLGGAECWRPKTEQWNKGPKGLFWLYNGIYRASKSDIELYDIWGISHEYLINQYEGGSSQFLDTWLS